VGIVLLNTFQAHEAQGAWHISILQGIQAMICIIRARCSRLC
jgi:hypothetical protein